MIILSANGITKAYGTDVILKDISFHINAGDRVGLIGLNGAGKTTLLNILSGDLDADSGNVFVSNDTVIGYLRQNDDFTSENTVIEEIDGIFTELHRMEREMPALSQQIAEATASGSKSPQEIEVLLQIRSDAGGLRQSRRIYIQRRDSGRAFKHGVCRGYIQQKNKHAFGR